MAKNLQRRRLYAAADGPGRVVVVDSDGQDVAKGAVVDVAQQLHDEKADIGALDAQLLLSVVDAYLQAGQAHSLDVAMRGTGLSGAPAVLSIRRTGWGAAWRDLAATHPDGDPAATAADLGLGRRPADGPDAARWLAQLDTQWREWAEAELGAELGITLAATAARLAIPRQWRTAHEAAKRGARRPGGLDDSAWRLSARAFYGGRVACLVDDSWRGEAVEYDLRSAYGWALTCKLPDWKCYRRKPWPSEPAWYDVTVEISTSGPGPLPYRDPEDARVLHYPVEGVYRGAWTREELDRSGVRVLQQHEVLAGRWSYDLQPVVSSWLERRQLGGALRRRLFRFLPNSLAGKLAQKSVGWLLWDAADGDPPVGAVPLGLSTSAFVVPVPARYQPATFPQAGSYVTSLVRGLVWPQLQRPDALYSDTDSIHLPASATPPPLGDAAGQWAEKERGPAVYRGPKNYTIGSKTAGFLPHHSGHFGRSTGHKPTTAQPRK